MIVHWAVPTLRNMLSAGKFDVLFTAHSHPPYPCGGTLESFPFFDVVTRQPTFTISSVPREEESSRAEDYVDAER